jgi:hypothetical protein
VYTRSNYEFPRPDIATGRGRRNTMTEIKGLQYEAAVSLDKYIADMEEQGHAYEESTTYPTVDIYRDRDVPSQEDTDNSERSQLLLNGEYMDATVVNKGYINKKLHYEMLWKGYEKTTWEPDANVCDGLIEEYNMRKNKAKKDTMVDNNIDNVIQSGHMSLQEGVATDGNSSLQEGVFSENQLSVQEGVVSEENLAVQEGVEYSGTTETDQPDAITVQENENVLTHEGVNVNSYMDTVFANTRGTRSGALFHMDSVPGSRIAAIVVNEEGLYDTDDRKDIEGPFKEYLPAIKNHNLYLAQSEIPQAGRGLFAGTRHAANNRVGIYSKKGYATEKEALQNTSDGDGDCVVYFGNKYFPGNRKTNYAVYINDPLDDTKINTKFRITPAGSLEIITNEQVVEKDEEFYMSYGSQYWSKNLTEAPMAQILQCYPELDNKRIKKTKIWADTGSRETERLKNSTIKEYLLQQLEILRKDCMFQYNLTHTVNKVYLRNKETEVTVGTIKQDIRMQSDNPTIKQAQRRGDWPEWQKAIEEEMTQLQQGHVFEYVQGPLPDEAKLIGSMLILQLKRNPDGTPDKYKARLVALGNQQENMYKNISSSTARSASVKILASIQAKTSGYSFVLDVKGAYLQSTIVDEEDKKLHVRLPGKQVVKLQKYLYGLKQSGFQWQLNVTQCLIKNGYKQSGADPCVFSKTSKDKFVITCLHVDDFFAIASDKSLLQEMHEILTKQYGTVTIKNGDMLSYLGMQVVVNSDNSVTISQPGYTQKILREHLQDYEEWLNNGRITASPMSTVKKEDVKNRDDTPVCTKAYLSIVGSLNYLAQFTRPDILYPMSVVAQSCSKPTKYDLTLCQKILRYIASTPDNGITFSKGEVKLVSFCDASHQCYNDAKGHYGYTFALGANDGVFHAVSRKIKNTTTSSTESEYVGLYEATRDAIWLRRLLDDIGFTQDKPTLIYQDNLSTMDFTEGNLKFNTTKHINSKYHFTREMVANEEIILEHMPTAEMLADALTKPLSRLKHVQFARKMLNQKILQNMPD